MEISIFRLILFAMIIIYCIYVIICEKRSIRSDIIEKGVKLSKYKTIVSNEKIYDKHLKKIMNSEEEEYKLPKIKFRNKVNVLKYLNMSYLIINENDNPKKIFYLHGGSYIENPLLFHYKFLDDIAKRTNLEVIVPIYPKAPKYNYELSYDKVYKLYNKLFDSKNNVILMGDSSGGGFALSLAMLIRNNGGIKPTNIILLSPWLDITMQNKNIRRYEKKDPLLDKKALIKAGNLWVGQKGDAQNWMVSPINGNFDNLGTITIFIGTHEIFLPDARKFRYILNQKKINFNYYEYKKMNHVFPLYPIPEAQDAQKKIIEIIKTN